MNARCVYYETRKNLVVCIRRVTEGFSLAALSVTQGSGSFCSSSYMYAWETGGRHNTPLGENS